MAFNATQRAFADSLFRQAGGSLGAGNGSSATMPVFSFPNASKQDQHATSFGPWTHDDLRKPTDTAEFDWETDLQGLVSNIVDEADSSDSCFNGGLPPMCHSIWSPKTMREELLLQCQSDAKTQQNHPFPPNYTSHSGFSRAQQQSAHEDSEGPHQRLNGLAQQWLLNGPNGDNHSSGVQKLPQGLPTSDRENVIWSQQSKYDSDSQQSKYDSDQPMNSLADLGDVFRPLDEMNSSSFGPFYEEHCAQSSVKPAHHEPYTAEDINQLMRHLQSLVRPEHGAGRPDSFPNALKRTAGLNRDDNVAEQWKSSISAVHVPKQSGGEMKPVPREHNGGMKNQTLKRQVFQHAPDFSLQNAAFHQQPKSSLPQLNLANQTQKKKHGENFHVNGYLKEHGQLKQMQSNMKPQMQKEKQWMFVPGFRGGSSPIGAQTNTPTRAGVNHPYLDFHGSVQPQKFDGENGTFPVNDLRRPPRAPFNYNARPYGGGGDMMSPSEAVPLNYFARRGENMHQVTAFAVANSVMMKQGGPVIQSPPYLDECYEQWRCLENERMMAEGFIMNTFLVPRSPAGSNSTLPKMSPTPAIIGQLLLNQMREQTKVANLLDKMECVHRLSLHVNIHTALSRHHTAVCVLLERRKEAELNKQRAKDVVLTDIALKELAAATRQLRTALWCSLQMIIPFPAKTQDQHINREDTRSASPCQGYAFNI